MFQIYYINPTSKLLSTQNMMQQSFHFVRRQIEQLL